MSPEYKGVGRAEMAGSNDFHFLNGMPEDA